MDEEIRNEIETKIEETVEAAETAAEAAEDQVFEAPEITDTQEEDAIKPEDVGNIKISVDVVSTIAGIATNEIEGVAGMYGTFAGGIAEMLGARKNSSKGVKVDMNGRNVIVDLYIVVEYGVRIPELAWEIQESVKNNVETMTGLDVQKVNIHIEGVSFEKEKAQQEAREAQENTPADDTEEEITD